MATEGYSAQYQKTKNSRLRSVSPSHYQNSKQSPRRHLPQSDQSQLGKVMAQLTDRVDGIQIKIVNITNIIKLFQKYTESKDIQYQKQKQNDEFRKNVGDKATSNLQQLETQTKINELEALIQRTKSQITAMEGLRVSIQRQNSKKAFSSPQPFETMPKTIQSPATNANTVEIMQEIEEIMDKMEINLRQQINKKIDICMAFVKNATQGTSQNSSGRHSSPSTVNAIMMQQQLHNMTLTVHKVESDCSKNKMIIQSKIQQIVNYVNSLRKQNERESSRSHSRSAARTINNAQQDQSQNSSLSKRSKKSKSRSNKNITERAIQSSKTMQQSRLQQQKKLKQTELREALKKKKQNQQKLKMRK